MIQDRYREICITYIIYITKHVNDRDYAISSLISTYIHFTFTVLLLLLFPVL